MVFLRALILFLVLQDCTEIGFTAPSGLLKSLLTNLISEDNSLLTNLIEEDNPMKLFGSLGTSRKLSMTLLLIEKSKSLKKWGQNIFKVELKLISFIFPCFELIMVSKNIH